MQITVAKTAGFCFGVDRAMKLVYAQLDAGTSPVATLGPIIHNKNVVDDLEKRGVRIIENVSDIRTDELLVIRSHGVAASVYDEVARLGNPLIDATCPFVSKIHRIVRDMSEQGRFILIAGDKSHPEVQGILGNINGDYFVFANYDELKNFLESNLKIRSEGIAILAQTTYNIGVWDRCISLLREKCTNYEIFETICNATSARQSEAVQLASESDLMLVIGGKHSSNTKKLFSVCEAYCKTFHFEDSAELESQLSTVKEYIRLSNARKIGITAGASTPAYIIKEVKTTMALETTNFSEDINFEEALNATFKKIHTGERVKGIIAGLNVNEAIVDVGTKHTGYIPLDELTDDPSLKPADVVKIGDEVELIVIKVNDAEGFVNLSKKRVDSVRGLEAISTAFEEGAVLEGTVSQIVKGGVVVLCNGVKVFIPASQTGVRKSESLDSLAKQKVNFKIIEMGERNRPVGSIRLATKEVRDAAKKKFWDNAEIGQHYHGIVRTLTSYGAFVDIGGPEGMVHITELSWSKLRHPDQVLSVGDEIEVYIKDLDREKERISLGYKKPEDNPWFNFSKNYNIGDVVEVTIVSITPFGAFANIVDGIDGLIHVSQISNVRVSNVADYLAIGDKVNVKITDIDEANQRISLSIRELLADEAAQDNEYDEASDADND